MCALLSESSSQVLCRGVSVVSESVEVQVHVFLILSCRYVIKSTPSSLGASSLEVSCDTCRSFMAGNSTELDPVGILLLEPNMQ